MGTDWYLAVCQRARALLPKRLVLLADYFMIRDLNDQLAAGGEPACMPLKEQWSGFFDVSLKVLDEIPRTRAGKSRWVVRAAPLGDSPQEGLSLA